VHVIHITIPAAAAPGSCPPGAPCATKRRSHSGSPRRPRPCVTAS